MVALWVNIIPLELKAACILMLECEKTSIPYQQEITNYIKS
ncbi:hypothetical protein ACJW30_07G026500 [Castanea mollissima]